MARRNQLPELPGGEFMDPTQAQPGQVQGGGVVGGEREDRAGETAQQRARRLMREQGGTSGHSMETTGRFAGDFPCAPGQCKDVVTGQCRSVGKREKINETDDIERASGGGRGYCKQIEAGKMGRGGGLGMGQPASLADEQGYFDRITAAGEWTDAGGGWFYNDPGNDPSRRRWVNRNNLQLDSSGRGYLSASQRGGPMQDLGGGAAPGGSGPGAFPTAPAPSAPGAPGGSGPFIPPAPGAPPVPKTPSGAPGGTAPGLPPPGGAGQTRPATTAPGAPPPAPGAPPAPATPGDLNSQIEQMLSSIMSGGQTRFSPEVMADLTAQGKIRQQAEVESGLQALNEDLASRGIASTAAGASLAQGVRQKAAQSFDAAERENRTKKAFYDFEDKMNGLTKAQQNLDALRQFQLGLDQNSIQREQIAASIQMAREQISAQARNLAAQLAANKDLAGMQIGANADLQSQQLGSQEFMFMQGQLRCLINPAAC